MTVHPLALTALKPCPVFAPPTQLEEGALPGLYRAATAGGQTASEVKLYIHSRLTRVAKTCTSC